MKLDMLVGGGFDPDGTFFFEPYSHRAKSASATPSMYIRQFEKEIGPAFLVAENERIVEPSPSQNG